MSLNDLDNPGWHALNSHHRHLAVSADLAVRYPSDTFFTGAMLENSADAFDDLRSLVEIDETIGVVGPLPEDLPGWQVLFKGRAPQMTGEDLKPVAPVEAIKLTKDDVPEMLDLVALAEPGPFLPRTIEMGDYLGLRQDGQLVAMAGERLHLTGYCEISAVCTHPDYRGRGYASALTSMVAEGIMARQELPFLHLSPTNAAAKRLYIKLGFRLRKEIQLNMIQRIDS